jgi:phosphoribosyl-AMP cyclohydrolase
VAAVLSLKTGCGEPVLLSRAIKSRTKVSLPRVKVSRKLLRKEHIMKNLVDKPSKTVLYIITILLYGTIVIGGNSHFHKTIDTTPQIAIVNAEITEPSDKVNNDIVVVEVTEEVAPKQQVRTRETLSRGGTSFKPPSERDIINSYVRDIAPKYNMEPELIMSIIESESTYNPRCKTGNCLGLMQVSSYWHKDRMLKLGVSDLYDPYGNILVAVDYLSELCSMYKDMRLVLMMYNMEHDTAMRLYKTGQISYYARSVLERAEKYKKGEL